MKLALKINFADFWEPFNKTDNFFYNLLSKKYSIEISEDPDFLFYSCYGKSFLQYKCIRIFFASENKRPDFLHCDYALSFDFINKPNHYRLPLYQLYIDGHGYYERLNTQLTIVEATNLWKQKTKFCCMLVSNPNAKERIDFFNALSAVKHVDSGGRYLNNIGYAVENKMEFIKDYKFVIAFENSNYQGYTTEKILEPLVAGCIPVYWGSSSVVKDFNKACFLNMASFDGFEPLIKKMIDIDSNDELGISMIAQRKTAATAKDHLLIVKEVALFLDNITQKENNNPVAKSKMIQLAISGKSLFEKMYRKLLRN